VSLCYHFGNKNKNSTFAFPVWQSNTFNHHPMVWVWWMITEFLWSPSNGGVMSNGNQFFLITIQHTPICPMATKVFWLPRKGGVSYDFGKPLIRAFQKKGQGFSKNISHSPISW